MKRAELPCWILAFALVGCGPGGCGAKADDTAEAPSPGTTGAGATSAGVPSGSMTDGHCWGIAIWNDLDGEGPQDTDGDGVADTGCGDTLDLCIVDPLGVVAWDFGMVGPDWAGEDCLHGEGTVAVCHAIHAPQHTLTEVCRPDQVVGGSTTRFDASSDPDLTYYLAEPNACFVWGADVGYYASLGCDELL